MRLWTRPATSATLAAMLCFAGYASAEEATPEEPQSQQRFDDAVTLFIDGEYTAALVAFEQIRETTPSAVVDYNIAWCLSRLGRDAESLDAFERYLSRWPNDDPERHSQALDEVARLRGVIVGWPQAAGSAAEDEHAQEPADDEHAQEPADEHAPLTPWIDEQTSQEESLPPPEVEAPGEGEGRDGRFPSSPFGWLDLDLELNAAFRSFRVPINPACDTSGRDLAAFETGAYPEIAFRLSFFPGGIFTRRWPAGFGVEVVFRHHLHLEVLNSRTGVEVDTSTYFVSLGAVYRYSYGTVDRGVSVSARLGFDRYSFFLGDEGNDIVPPVVYDSVYLGLSVFAPFGTRYVGAEIGANYLGVFGFDSRMIEAYNASGELPHGNGYQAFAGLSGQIYRGLRWRFGFEILGVISEHSGKGHGYGVAEAVGDPSTLCTSSDCIMFPGCINDTVPDRPAVTGGIYTTGTARDLDWRVIIGLSYRFAGDPDR